MGIEKRGMPFEDQELTSQRRVMIPATIWMLAGVVISIFVPIGMDVLLFLGLIVAAIGMILVALVFQSFAKKPVLATEGIHRYSRNPNYIGWTLLLRTNDHWLVGINLEYLFPCVSDIHCMLSTLECATRGEVSSRQIW